MLCGGVAFFNVEIFFELIHDTKNIIENVSKFLIFIL